MSNDGDDDTRINNRLRRKPAALKLTPRSYQTEFLRKVLQENTIVYLGTGLGKTFIVVMFLNHPKIYRQIQNKRKVIFMATSRDLIKQQAEYINKQVPYRVKVYCGGSGLGGVHVDKWMRSAWQSELQLNDILCVMPQIFLAALTNKLIDWSQISAVIFDECHNAVSKSKGTGSPYKQILEHYQEHYCNLPDLARNPRPRIIGLTASLINDMPKSTTSEYVRNEVINLEQIFSAKCVTDLQVREKKPRIVVQKFSSSNLTSQNDLLLNLLEQTEILVKKAIDETHSKNRHNKSIYQRGSFVQSRSERGGASFETAYERMLKLAAIGFSIKPEDFPPIFKDLAKIRCDYGLWILSSICQKLEEALKSSTSYQITSNPSVSSIYTHFVGLLEKIRKHIEDFLASHEQSGLLQQTSSKPKALLYILELEAKRAQSDSATTFSCVIFVSNRLEVVALNEWLQQVSETCSERYGFIKSNWAVGLAGAQTSRYACVTRRTPSEQADMLRDFREGTLNVIVTTSVLEEGIDLPVCSSVIRYDEVQNFRQHVQSRGRARQAISSFILMCEEKDYSKMINNLRKFNEFESVVKETLRKNDIRSSSGLDHSRTIDANSNGGDGGGNQGKPSSASMKPTSVLRSILDRYLNCKSRQTPFTGGLKFERYGGPPNSFQTKLFFPFGCPFSDGIEGAPKRSIKAADNAALIAAIDALQAASELNENGVPTWLETKYIDTYLAEGNLEPRFDKLDSHLEGIQIKTTDKDSKLKVKTYFKPCVDAFQTLCLSKNFENRTYKLLKISYIADVQKSRFETRTLLEKPVFGMILDSTTSCDFFPSVLYSHYGQIEVRTEEISSNLKLTSQEDHSKLLSFTHKLLSRCLLFNDLPIDDFNCLFYLVALDKGDWLDVEKMQKSFGDIQEGVEVEKGDVVGVASGDRRSDEFDDGDQLMLVRTVLEGFNIDSMSPSGFSYRQRAQKRLGNSTTIRSQQRLIEVMTISREFAKLEQGKQSQSDYRSKGLYYLEQELDLFDKDASCVLQAFIKPAIIHSLFLQTIASELDKKLSGTSTTNLLGRQPENEEEKICNSMNRTARPHEDESPIVCADDEDSDVDPTILNDIVNFDDIMNCSKKMKTYVGDDDDNNDVVEDKQTEYKEHEQQQSHKVPAEELYYANPDLHLESRAQTAPTFQQLAKEIELDRLGFVAKLSNFDLKSVDIRLLLEESALFNRSAKVDNSIKPPMKFDRNQKPLKKATRSRSLLEALTLSRAQGSMNYECLENIGDSFIKHVVSMVLFLKTNGDEGFLTSARSRLTTNKYFTHLAKKNNLGSYAITHPFCKDQLAFLMGKHNKTSPKGRGSNLIVETNYNQMDAKNLADLVESIIGSRLVYHGEYEAMRTIQTLGLDIFDNSIFCEFHKEAVVFTKCPTALFELSQPLETFESDYQALIMKLGRFEEVLNYKFNDISYLIQAFTHSSTITKYTKSYERLEFIGDSVLDYLVTIHLATFGSKSVREDPGQISTSRSALVNNYFFAKLALKYTFDLFISHGTYSILDSLNKVHTAMEDDPEMRFLDMVNYDDIVKLLGDVFESVAAAIYLDSGNSLDTLWSVYYPMMKEFIDAEIEHPTKNLIAELHESFPSKKGAKRIVFNYYATEKKFEEHLTRAVCTIVGYRSFEGKGLTRRQAKLRAVKEAITELPDRTTRDQLNRKFNQQL